MLTTKDKEEDDKRALNWAVHEQLHFVKFYNSLPEKPKTLVRFFQHKDFYTVHAEDATYVTLEHFHGLKIKEMGSGNQKLSYVCFKKAHFDKLIKELLLVLQYRVEVYVKKEKGKWELEYKGSPGNLIQFEEILFQSDHHIVSSCVMAINIGPQMKISVGCVDGTEYILFATEFQDNEYFTELESLIAKMSPKECLMPTGANVELKNLSSMLKRNTIPYQVTSKSNYVADQNLIHDLNRLLYFHESQSRNAHNYAETSLKGGMECLAALIKYMNLTSSEGNFNQFKIKSLNAKRTVRVDNAALHALNILPIPGETKDRNVSVYGVLDHCCTRQGRRLLLYWIKLPVLDLNIINERLDVVEALVNDTERRSKLTKLMSPIPDMLIMAKKLFTKKVSLENAYKIYSAVMRLPHILNLLDGLKNKSVHSMLLSGFVDLMPQLRKFKKLVEQTIDLDLAAKGEYHIKSTFDDELDEIRKRKDDVEEKIQIRYKKACKHFKPIDVRLDSVEHIGYYFRVTNKNYSSIKDTEFTVLEKNKSGVKFIDDKVQDMNKEHRQLKKSYEEKQKHVVAEILDVVCSFSNVIKSSNLLIAQIDVMLSLAKAAVSAPKTYVRPKMLPLEAGTIRLVRARHPIIEKFEEIEMISNDCTLSKEGKFVHIITGPNMGGKSTFLRTVATCVFLAHIGSFVPCDEAEISLVDSILTRVGAEDCEAKGISTFMMEMIDTCSIVRTATKNSLVIIDELGRGTSTYDGCGISWSVLDQLAKENKPFTLFATHFFELTKIEYKYDCVGNYHVTTLVQTDKIVPMFEIKEGPSDKSYGIECAKMAGFSEKFLTDAQSVLKELNDHTGMTFIKHLRPREQDRIMEEGHLILVDAMRFLKNVDANNLTDEELVEKANEVKRKLASSDNLYVKGIVAAHPNTNGVGNIGPTVST